MEYQILKVASVTTMENAVNSLLDEGWELAGGVSAEQNYLVQALVRKK